MIKEKADNSKKPELEVVADLVIEINVDCPHCDYPIDMTDADQCTEDGLIWKRALDGNQFGHDKAEIDFKCPECRGKIIVNTINW